MDAPTSIILLLPFSLYNMDLKNSLLGSVLLLLLLAAADADVEKDKEKCANQLVGLATCLPYVGGDAKAPTKDCCTGFRQVLKDSRQCVCILIKDRDDPSLGLKINATLALSLPAKCDAPLDQSVTDCPSILHLPPNSPDAKVFQEFANTGNKTNSTAAPATASSSRTNQKNDGGVKRRWFETQMVSWVLLAMAALDIFSNI